MAIEKDRVVFYTHPDDPAINIDIGSRVACAMVQIADDEGKAVAEERSAARKKPRSPSNMAAMLCKEPEFQVWAAARYASDGYGSLPPGEDTARRYIVMVCDIASRSELDSMEAAYVKFQMLVELPYYKHMHQKSE